MRSGLLDGKPSNGHILAVFGSSKGVLEANSELWLNEMFGKDIATLRHFRFPVEKRLA